VPGGPFANCSAEGDITSALAITVHRLAAGGRLAQVFAELLVESGPRQQDGVTRGDARSVRSIALPGRAGFPASGGRACPTAADSAGFLALADSNLSEPDLIEALRLRHTLPTSSPAWLARIDLTFGPDSYCCQRSFGLRSGHSSRVGGLSRH